MDSCVDSLEVPTTIAYILAAISIILALMASFGNLLFFVVILRNRQLHTRSNACLVSLATTDMLAGIILEPIHIIQLFDGDYRNDCKLNFARRLVMTFFICSSVGAVTVVSYDRYMHLSKTVNYLIFMTKRKMIMLLVTSWLVSLIISMSNFAEEFMSRVFIIVYISISFTIMITCYVTILRITKHREDALRSALTLSTTIIHASIAKEAKTHIRVAKAISIIIALFCLTFAPWAIFFIVISVSELSNSTFITSYHAKENAYAVLATAVLANSAINPIVYYLRIPKFKESFKRCARPFYALSLRDMGSSHNGSNSRCSRSQRGSSTRASRSQRGSSTRGSTNQPTSSIRRDTNERASSIRRDTTERTSSIRRDTTERTSSIRFDTNEGASFIKRDTKEGASYIWCGTKERASSIRRDTTERTSSIRFDMNEGASFIKRDTKEGASSIKRDTNARASSIRRDTNERASSIRFDIEQTEF
eukprot:Seg1839.3 transcript_id=Seg1839.3/GoldUCD/mRNA.D3Y31 product="hypothetical protein" protein_id=Seg1839.3/GoldUCD/D3Y31